MLALFITFTATFVFVLSHNHHSHHLHDHYFDTPPPPQDECKSVNATEPPQCPMTIGPPCPPCYTNFAADYTTGDDLMFSNSDETLMKEFREYYTNWWADNYPPHKTSGGFDIYSGSGGRGQIFLRLFQNSDNNNETLLNIGEEYINHAISILPSSQYYSAYMSSHVGVWTLKSFIAFKQDDISTFTQYMDQINRTYINVLDAIMNNLNTSSDGINMTLYDMETGLTGLVYNGLFINTLFSADIINPSGIANITWYVMNAAIETGQMLNTNYLQVPFTFLEGCYLYGVNHGPTGLIHQFINAYHLYPTEMDQLFNNPIYYNAIKNTLDYYISIQLPDGNMPTQIGGNCYKNYGNDSDARVQFCHGAPGFINVYMESVIMFSKYNKTAAEIYFNTALVTANVTWKRGLLVKGTMFCHGIGANINMLWNLAQNIDYLQKNGDKEFLKQLENDGYDLEYLKNQSIWRAKQFTLWTLNWSNINSTRIYDSNEGSSMFAGNYAIQMLYSQILSGAWPYNESACHPGWNLCL